MNDVGLKPSPQIIVICELTILWSWTDCRCRPRIKSSTDLAIVRKLEFWVYALLWRILFLHELSHWSSQVQLLTKFINAEMEKCSAALNVIQNFCKHYLTVKPTSMLYLGIVLWKRCSPFHSNLNIFLQVPYPCPGCKWKKLLEKNHFDNPDLFSTICA